MVGPASATDLGIARYDGTTGKLLQNSSVVVDDSGNLGIGTGADALLSPLTVKTGGFFLFHNSGGGGGGSVFENTAVGYKAGNALAGTGYANVLIGKNAGLVLNGTSPAASSNVMVGYGTGSAATTAFFNVFVGSATGTLVTTQSENTLVGYHAGEYIKSGSNTFLGYFAGRGHATLATGSSNVAFGGDSLKAFTTAQLNSAVGKDSLALCTSCANNSVVGSNALQALTTAADNIAVGFRAGQYLTDGTTANATPGTSVYLGSMTKANAAGGANEIVIGYNAIGAGSNTATLGNTSITRTVLRGTQHITPQASAPGTCIIGDVYVDTSGGYCHCGVINTWENLSATGSCA